MKKRYEMPEVQVVKINSTAILAGSPGAPIDPNGYVNPGEVESRRGRRDDWDDEDEEDW
jgi:hypothetical protein